MRRQRSGDGDDAFRRLRPSQTLAEQKADQYPNDLFYQMNARNWESALALLEGGSASIQYSMSEYTAQYDTICYSTLYSAVQDKTVQHNKDQTLGTVPLS